MDYIIYDPVQRATDTKKTGILIQAWHQHVGVGNHYPLSLGMRGAWSVNDLGGVWRAYITWRWLRHGLTAPGTYDAQDTALFRQAGWLLRQLKAGELYILTLHLPPTQASHRNRSVCLYCRWLRGDLHEGSHKGGRTVDVHVAWSGQREECPLSEPTVASCVFGRLVERG